MQNEPTQEQVAAAADLADAIRLQDGARAETAIFRTFSRLHPLHARSLMVLAEAPWHHRHEDVVRALQDLRSPSAVDALERVAPAVYNYLDCDNGFALARRCTWALADIGTPEAHQALTRLAACENPVIASYAEERLTN
jgi:hypothetical protein